MADGRVAAHAAVEVGALGGIGGHTERAVGSDLVGDFLVAAQAVHDCKIAETGCVKCFHRKALATERAKKQRIIEELVSTLLRSWAT